MGLNKRLFAKESLSEMWFFQDRLYALFFSLLTLTFLAFNVAIFVHDYHDWIRSFQFVLCLLIWATIAGMCMYWRRAGAERLARNEAGHAALISAPIISMTVFMGVGSVLGVLHITYFTSVFADCDKATNASTRWQTASDFVLQTTLLAMFCVYPIFILKTYSRPLPRRWTWLLFLLTSSMLVLFAMISLDEAFHAYVHLCDNWAVLSHEWCPVEIPKHEHFKCGEENFTAIQALWVELHEQVIGPGAFLIICEYLPLLFALVWMVPVRDGRSAKARSSIAGFFHDAQPKAHRVAATEEPAAPPEKDAMLLHEKGPGEVRFRKPSQPDAVTDRGGKTVDGVPPPSRTVQLSVQVLAVVAVLAVLIRLGLLLNHVGRFPEAELLFETAGHLLLVLTLLLLYSVAYFGWLRGFKIGEINASQHHLAHARFDSFLLRIASVLISVHILISGTAELRMDDWTSALFLLHKIPVLASLWMQYVVVARALRLEGAHWKLLRKRTAVGLCLSLLTVNFMEWVAQFVKRRFTVFVLDTGGPITALVTACIALSGIRDNFYPRQFVPDCWR